MAQTTLYLLKNLATDVATPIPSNTTSELGRHGAAVLPLHIVNAQVSRHQADLVHAHGSLLLTSRGKHATAVVRAGVVIRVDERARDVRAGDAIVLCAARLLAAPAGPVAFEDGDAAFAVVVDDGRAARRRREPADGAGKGERLLVYFCAGRACLDHDALRCLAPHELRGVTCASARVRDRLARVDYVSAKGCVGEGRQPHAPFPHFPGLFRDLGPGGRGGLFRHQLASLAAMRRLETRPGGFGTLRGGVLGDAPGLGKTVTVLALALASAGELPQPPTAFWDGEAVDAAFKALRHLEMELRREILTGLRPLLAHRDSFARGSTAWAQADALLRGATPPFDFASPRALEAHLRGGAGKLAHLTPAERDEVRLEFAYGMALVRCRLDSKRRSALYGAAGKRALAERTLRPTGGTLVVVPDALLEHWKHQIAVHVDLKQVAPSFGDGKSGDGCCYVHGFGDAATWRGGAAGGAAPLRVGGRVPRADARRKYLIVVVPFSACRLEARLDAEERAAKDRNVFRHGPSSDATASPLLALRWLRLVVDEGHELAGGPEGEKKSKTRPAQRSDMGPEASAFVAEIFAERRWVVSGTPTTGDIDDPAATTKHLDQLQKLMKWLRHPDYGLDVDPRLDGAAAAAASATAKKKRWAAVAEPFAKAAAGLGDGAAGEAARAAVVDLLRTVVVRHRKEDLELPKPVIENVEIEVEPVAGESDTDFQWRVDCAMADHVAKTLRRGRDAGNNPKMAVFSQHEGDLQSVAEALYDRLGASCIAEFDVRRLGHATSTRELVRFRYDEARTRTCPVCGSEEDADAKLCGRTLIEVEILDDAVADARTAAFYADPDGGEPSAAARVCGKRVLVEPERILHVDAAAAPGAPADGAAYAANFRNWRVGDEITVTFAERPPFARRRDDATWRRWGKDDCVRRAVDHGFDGGDWYLGPLWDDAGPPRHGPVRCRLLKWARCGNWHGRWFCGPKLDRAPVVVRAEKVPVLCLTREASHGLDLSFLTHIFLLEPIRDSALLEQVISRAHRVGAVAPVLVHTLVPLVKGDGAAPPASPPASPRKAERTKHFICDHCYKSFATNEEADDHMLVCSRNPASDARRSARFTLNSCYDEIQPPPPF